MTTDTTSWFQAVWQLRGSILPAIFPRVLLCSALGFIISLINYYGYSLPEQIFGSVITNVAYNLVLGLLVVFRTNTAYDRYWEGRKIWGGIIINSLNLGRKIWLAVAETEPQDKDNKIAALKLLGAFAIATKLQLRRLPINTELETLLTQSQYSQLKEVKNPPLKIALWIGDYLQKQQIDQRLSMDELLAMNTSLDGMVEAFIGCERILTTPIPLAYAIYLKRLLLIYCFALPLKLVHDLHLWTGVIVALISFILLGIEEIGNQIEDPFGNDPNDLPLDEICTNLVNNLADFASEHESSMNVN
ncbi:putative membrane protein [Cylindrospermum stagnale PCC 7417]|uniref:Putative membrane protein n=1 Tax=Cylindrospermum stagnale PCC 7417 TaxID=56107 RepID=K9X7Y1_9NOST|nr:bestrophin family ion channel [Cylindrospermum stagnale]AFZ27772.1 putative membrane protein [Cylindrospermum stagnale PCC 7417]